MIFLPWYQDWPALNAGRLIYNVFDMPGDLWVTIPFSIASTFGGLPGLAIYLFAFLHADRIDQPGKHL